LGYVIFLKLEKKKIIYGILPLLGRRRAFEKSLMNEIVLTINDFNKPPLWGGWRGFL
jgi:hypothetical protein